jgi:hypothetical protein
MARMVPPGNFTAAAREAMANAYTAFKKGS